MTSATELGKEVEALFLRYVDAGRREVQAALVRIQATSSMPTGKRARNSKRHTTPTPGAKSSRSKRSHETLVEIGQKIVAVIRAQPGLSLREVASRLETTPTALSASMAILRKDGSIRSVGAKSQMRYFPAFARSDSRK